MGRALDYIKKEKEYYGDMLYNINCAINELSPYVDSKELNSRKFVTRINLLKKYIELLDEIEVMEKKDGIMGFMNDEERIAKLEDYKRKNRDGLEQLKNCYRCKRLQCPPTCKFSDCIDCRPGSWIARCDHKKIDVRFHENFILNLTNERTGKQEKYDVLATVHDDEKERQYIIIHGQLSGDKYVLYYYPGLVEDTYGEINDQDEFDFIVSTYEAIER